MRQIVERLRTIAEELKSKGLSVKIDDRDNVRSGFKFAEYELKGVPVRLALGPATWRTARSNWSGAIRSKRKPFPKRDSPTGWRPDGRNPAEYLPQGARLPQFDDYQSGHVGRIRRCAGNKGGFISAHWDGTVETEVAIKDATKATIRCIPMDAVEEEGKCVFSGKPSHRRVLFARSY